MKVEKNNSGEVIMLNATKIISKYRSKKDRILFCPDKNQFHQDEQGFDSKYFLQVLSGHKKYLPGNFCIRHKLGFFSSGVKLDKQYILNKMNGNPTYGE